jgi:hypothetical protein
VGGDKPTRQRELCLATYLREANPSNLLPAEARALRKDREWAAANPVKAAELDALVNCDVEAVVSRRSIDETTRFQVGNRYVVAARWLDGLIVYDQGGLVLFVKAEWVKKG